MICKMPLVKENKERKNVRYSKDDFAYQSLPFSFERDPVERWMKQAARDEEVYWQTKFEEMI